MNRFVRNFSAVLMGLFCVFSIVHADTEQMNETLLRIVNQLDAILPLIDEAERQQSQNERFMFHFSQYEGSDGKIHEGLREDVMSMKEALIQQMNAPAVDPDTVSPINNDFIGGSQ